MSTVGMLRLPALGALAAWIGLLGVPATADALTFNYQISNQSNANSITVSDGGVNATASGWGGITNPQNTLDPTNPSGSGAQNLGVNIGTALGFGRGIGCGTVIGTSQCDLISPAGEDALLVAFSATVQITRIYGTLLENPDDISAWSWNGSGWDLIGTDNCPPGGWSVCGSFSQYDGEDIGHVGGGTLLPSNPTKYLLLVAENTNASAFRLGYVEANVVVPEPGSALLMLVGLAGVHGLRRRRIAS
jgi:hypothetical protein